MIKILNDILVLINANVEKDESNKTFMIQLTFRNLDHEIINLASSDKLAETIKKMEENGVSPLDKESIKHYLGVLIEETKQDLENEILQLKANVKNDPSYTSNVFSFLKDSLYRESDRMKLSKYNSYHDFITELFNNSLEENIDNIDFIRKFANAYSTLTFEVSQFYIKESTAHLVDLEKWIKEVGNFNFYENLVLSHDQNNNKIKIEKIPFRYKISQQELLNFKFGLALYKDSQNDINFCAVFDLEEMPIIINHPYQVIFNNNLYIGYFDNESIAFNNQKMTLDQVDFIAPILTTYY